MTVTINATKVQSGVSVRKTGGQYLSDLGGTVESLGFEIVPELSRGNEVLALTTKDGSKYVLSHVKKGFCWLDERDNYDDGAAASVLEEPELRFYASKQDIQRCMNRMYDFNIGPLFSNDESDDE